MSAPRVTAVIVTHNSPPVLRNVVESLLAQSVPLAHIVIVDCGSRDTAAVEALERLSPLVSVRLKGNLGFTGGNNLGIAEFKDRTDFFALVNPDAVLDPDWIADALQYLQRPDAADVGVVSSPLLGLDVSTLEPTGLWDSLGIYRKWPRGWGEPAQQRSTCDVPRPAAPFEPDAICGALMFFPSRLVDVVSGTNGFFDETLFTYKEDIELSLRIRRAGYRLILLPQLTAYHCRGWPKRRIDTAYWTRWRSARNDLSVAARYYPRDLPLLLAKYLYVVSIERMLFGLRWGG